MLEAEEPDHSAKQSSGREPELGSLAARKEGRPTLKERQFSNGDRRFVVTSNEGAIQSLADRNELKFTPGEQPMAVMWFFAKKENSLVPIRVMMDTCSNLNLITQGAVNSLEEKGCIVMRENVTNPVGMKGLTVGVTYPLVRNLVRLAIRLANGKVWDVSFGIVGDKTDSKRVLMGNHAMEAAKG